MPWLPWLLVLLLGQSSVAPSPQATAAAEDLARHVKVTLSIRDGKTVFRSGEPIRLIVAFTADQPGYRVDNIIDKSARPEDEIQLSPEKGVFRWRELSLTPDSYPRDVVSEFPLSTQPVEMTMPLNNWLRFDEPGEYTVRIRTRRAYKDRANRFQAAAITTNPVTFKVVPMTAQEEEVEARRLSALLDKLTANDLKTQTERCEDLAFLVGDPGTREKVRRYVEPKGRDIGNWIGDLGAGLYISRSTPLVISLLEEEMRNPAKPVSHLYDLADLRVWMEMPSLVAEARGDMNALRAQKRARRTAYLTEYMNEAIASLKVRVGSAKRGTAMSVLSMIKNLAGTPADATPPVPTVVRNIIVNEFAELDPLDQGYLVQQHWKDIRDPKLLPALEKMTTSTDSWVRGMPMSAILEIAPERARTLFISQMLGPRPVNSGAFLGLPDETLPQLDRPLAEQIIGLAASANSRDQYELETKTRFLARYASVSVLPDIQALYERRGAQLERKVRVNLLSYLNRWDEAGAAERLDKALASERDRRSLLMELAGTRYTKAVDAVISVDLNSDDPFRVESAAYLISQHGFADGRQALEARLARWMNEWSGRTTEIEPDPKSTTAQGRLQAYLIRAILNGKAWKVSEADATRLRQSCVTESCRLTLGVR